MPPPPIGLASPSRDLFLLKPSNLTLGALLPQTMYSSSVRLILDTCVIVSAFRSPLGPSHRLLRIFDDGRYDLLASTALFLEYEAVLNRPEQVAVHQLTSRQLDDALRDLADRIRPVAISRKYRPQLTDPNDEMVLEAAINGFADAIVTQNTRDFLPAAQSFGIEVLTPGSILKERFSQ